MKLARRDHATSSSRSTFLPESINGQARELDWLRNMGDWMISKKRFWGLALPIWVDEATGDFEVIGSREELKERAVEGWDEFEGHTPHRPWVDQVKIRNPKTGNLMSPHPRRRQPVARRRHRALLDDGATTRDRAYWEKWFPADFITESFPGQFRNWFYALLAMSTMMEQPAAVQGAARPRAWCATRTARRCTSRRATPSRSTARPTTATRSRTKGQGDQYPPIGADLMRWLYCRHNPAANINFGPGPADEVRSKFVLKLWNTYAFFCNYARLDGFDPAAPQVPVTDRPDIDRWILSDLQLLIQTAREAFEAFNVHGVLPGGRGVRRRQAEQLVRPPQPPPLLEERAGRRQAGRVPDAVHGADDADEAVRPGRCRSWPRRCTRTSSARRAATAGERPPVRLPAGRRVADRHRSCRRTWTRCCGWCRSARRRGTR